MRFRCSTSAPRTRRESSAGSSSRRRRRIAQAAVLAASLLAALAVAAFSFELALPGVSDAQSKVAAIVRAHHGALLRLPLSAKLAKAVVAVEDQHFYTNVFVNVLSGASRAAVASLERSGDPGGSTIAQQLAKQLYPQQPGLGTTLQDLALGVKLSFEYSKSEILDNVWDYGFSGDPNIVETYISYLRKKIDEFDPPLIQTVRRVGYCLRRPYD